MQRPRLPKDLTTARNARGPSAGTDVRKWVSSGCGILHLGWTDETPSSRRSIPRRAVRGSTFGLLGGRMACSGSVHGDGHSATSTPRPRAEAEGGAMSRPGNAADPLAVMDTYCTMPSASARRHRRAGRDIRCRIARRGGYRNSQPRSGTRPARPGNGGYDPSRAPGQPPRRTGIKSRLPPDRRRSKRWTAPASRPPPPPLPVLGTSSAIGISRSPSGASTLGARWAGGAQSADRVPSHAAAAPPVCVLSEESGSGCRRRRVHHGGALRGG